MHEPRHPQYPRQFPLGPRPPPSPLLPQERTNTPPTLNPPPRASKKPTQHHEKNPTPSNTSPASPTHTPLYPLWEKSPPRYNTQTPDRVRTPDGSIRHDGLTNA